MNSVNTTITTIRNIFNIETVLYDYQNLKHTIQMWLWYEIASTKILGSKTLAKFTRLYDKDTKYA